MIPKKNKKTKGEKNDNGIRKGYIRDTGQHISNRANTRVLSKK